MTGDSRLYELANKNRLPVHGVLWLLDEMVRLRVLVPVQVAGALRKMLEAGARVPQDECRKRLVELVKVIYIPASADGWAHHAA